MRVVVRHAPNGSAGHHFAEHSIPQGAIAGITIILIDHFKPDQRLILLKQRYVFGPYLVGHLALLQFPVAAGMGEDRNATGRGHLLNRCFVIFRVGDEVGKQAERVMVAG